MLLGAHRQWGLRRLLAQDGLGAEWVDTYTRALAQPGALSAALAWYRAATPFSLRAPRVSVPTLYVWGSGDPALGPRAAITTGRWITGAYRFEVLAGAGHWLPEHHAQELGRLLLEHLRRWKTGQQRRKGGPADIKAIELGGGSVEPEAAGRPTSTGEPPEPGRCRGARDPGPVELTTSASALSAEGTWGRIRQGSEPGGAPPKPPGAASPRDHGSRRKNPRRACRETGAAAPGFADRTLFPGGCPVLSS